MQPIVPSDRPWFIPHQTNMGKSSLVLSSAVGAKTELLDYAIIEQSSAALGFNSQPSSRPYRRAAATD
jgi:hypothetical protein